MNNVKGNEKSYIVSHSQILIIQSEFGEIKCVDHVIHGGFSIFVTYVVSVKSRVFRKILVASLITVLFVKEIVSLPHECQNFAIVALKNKIKDNEKKSDSTYRIFS